MQIVAGIVLPRVGDLGKAGDKLVRRATSRRGGTLGIQSHRAPQHVSPPTNPYAIPLGGVHLAARYNVEWLIEPLDARAAWLDTNLRRAA